MEKKLVGILVCTLMIVTTLPVIGNENIQNTSSVAPGIIGIKLVAKVFEVNDPYNLLGGVIHVNDTITGKYNYDSGIPDSEPNDPHVGKYIMTSSSYGFEVKAGGLVFKTNPSDIDFYLRIVNDYEYGYPHPDFYHVFSGNNLQLSNGMTVEQIRWDLEDPTGTVLSSDALPITAPVLADWESVYGLRLYGKDPSNPSKEYLVSAHVTRVTKSKARGAHFTEQPVLIWLLEHFANMFPILRQLMKL